MLLSAQRRSLQETNLLALLQNKAFEFADNNHPWFPYTSGQIGPYYIQSIAVERDGAAYAAAIQAVTEIIQSEFQNIDVISGGETRDWDFSNPAAVALQLPHIKIYKNGKTLGADIRGKRCLHVADLNNEGSSIRDYWKPILEKNGGILTGVIFYVDRMEDGADVMRELGLNTQAVVPLDETAWSIARSKGYVSDALYDSLVARLQDRHAWAKQALENNPALFQELYRKDATRAKAEKIMRTYPELQGFFDKLINSANIP